MSKHQVQPSFAEIVTRIDHDFFGRHGVFGISKDSRRRLIKLHVDEAVRGVFELEARQQIEAAAAPFSVAVVFEPPAHALAIG